ncbi:hypothetical protein GWN65_05530 [Candidatus Bathyarchaeota archaeon]|nr:hypothetical protein [Candidatus Bathyarchaeota archaeon]
MVFKLKSPRTTILILGTGKLVCTGARKEEDAHKAVDNLRQDLEKNNLIYLENES